MKVIRVFLLVLAALFCARISVAQELACKVTVNIQTLSEEERQIWQTFRADVEAYLNTYSWTTNFSGERIQCSVVFNITGSNGSDYTAQVFIQSNRPLNQSKELTTMARFLDDKVTFGYSRGLPWTVCPGATDNWRRGGAADGCARSVCKFDRTDAGASRGHGFARRGGVRD